ncbi:MAG: protein translocase subunit SecF, partial [Longispora sp.]|nr:protein translocase subunit SecF [Longispora sp. (in: high G+C Gram-positive bacteria)]
MSGLATRLYKGEAGLNVIGRRKLWFSIAATALLIAALSFGLRGFTLGIDFTGGNKFQVPASTGSITQIEADIGSVLAGVNSTSKVASTQRLGGGEGTYEIKTSPLSPEESFQVKSQLAEKLGIAPSKISDTQVSGA